MVLLFVFERAGPSRHLVLGRLHRENLGNKILRRFAFFLGGLLWFHTLHHVYLVAHPLLFPLLCIMGIGIVRIAHRPRWPLGLSRKLLFHLFELFPKDPP